MVADINQKSEIEIIHNVQAGNKEEFRHLIETYQEMILKLSYNYTQDWDEAEDQAQEIFLKAYQALPRFKMESSFKTWIYRIAINTLLTYRNKNKKIHDKTIDAPMVISDESELANPEQISEKTEQRNIIRGEIQNISSPKVRMAIHLRFSEDLSIKEIAKIMNIKEGTVKTLIHRGIKSLRKSMDYYKESLSNV